jgi:hypothetical protein
MATVEDFDHYLAQNPGHMDYWTDIGYEYATQLVHQMSLPEWHKLLAIWQSRPDDWQYRCAHVMAYANRECAMPLLLDFLQASSQDVVVRASESLRELCVLPDKINISQETLGKILNIASTHPGLVARVLEQFLDSCVLDESSQ